MSIPSAGFDPLLRDRHEAEHQFQALPEAHPSHLPHQRPHPAKRGQEPLHLGGAGARVRRNPRAGAGVEQSLEGDLDGAFVGDLASAVFLERLVVLLDRSLCASA